MPKRTSVVMRCSTAWEKTPIETIIPSKLKNKKPIVANAIFSSFVFIKEISDIILSNVDKPRKENRMNISISFICQTLLLS